MIWGSKRAPAAPEFEPPEPGLLQTALAAQKDDYLRLAADFGNFRTRTRHDSEERAMAEKESFIRDILPILDNLERALRCEGSTSSEQLHQGVEMTLQQLTRLLLRHGIEPVDSVGQTFDPHQHEAVAVRRDPGHADHIILEVIQRGYRHGKKVFRPAKVIVNDPGQSIERSRAR